MHAFRIPAMVASSILLFQSPEARLDQFQHEAERELRKPISVAESDDLGMANGQAFCDSNPVQIKIRTALDPETRQEVLAHELGHAYLCGRGLLIFTRITSDAVKEGLTNVVSSLSSGIESCFVDPLVTVEMTKRGFKTDMYLAEESRTPGDRWRRL